MKAARKPQGPLEHCKHLRSQSRSSVTSRRVWWSPIRSYTTEGDAALRFHPTVPTEETEQEERPQAQEWLPHQCKHAAVFAWNPLLILPLLCDCLKSKANISKFPGPVTKRRFRTLLGQHRDGLGAKRYPSSQRQEPGPPSPNPGCTSHQARDWPVECFSCGTQSKE